MAIYYGDGGMAFQYATGYGPDGPLKPAKGNYNTRRMEVVWVNNQWLDRALPENFQYPYQSEYDIFGILKVTQGITKDCPGSGDDRPRPDDPLIRPDDWCGIQYPCFTPNTLIIMADDTEKTISSVEVGDIVKSEKESSKVIKIDIHKGEFEVYSINGSEHFVTADHPLKTTEGWKSIDPTETFKVHGINSEVLKVGDVIIKIDGEEEITLIEGEKIVSEVYNLILDNEHVYYANGYLAHNKDYIGEQRQTTTDM